MSNSLACGKIAFQQSHPANLGWRFLKTTAFMEPLVRHASCSVMHISGDCSTEICASPMGNTGKNEVSPGRLQTLCQAQRETGPHGGKDPPMLRATQER